MLSEIPSPFLNLSWGAVSLLLASVLLVIQIGLLLTARRPYNVSYARWMAAVALVAAGWTVFMTTLQVEDLSGEVCSISRADQTSEGRVVRDSECGRAIENRLWISLTPSLLVLASVSTSAIARLAARRRHESEAPPPKASDTPTE